ncbi:MAG: N-acetyltransferase family protein [Arcticibacter sp.]
MIEVRKATVADYKLLSVLGRRAFQEAFGQYNDPGDMQAYLDLSFDPERIKSQSEDPNVIYLVANYHNEPVGYAKLVTNATTQYADVANQMQLERIYALGAYVGKKIGKALMLHIIELTRQAGFHYLWLSVWQQNDRAIKFYKDFGFEIIGVKKFFIGKEVNDDYVMGLKI